MNSINGSEKRIGLRNLCGTPLPVHNRDSSARSVLNFNQSQTERSRIFMR
jgi:hypothetical protein